MNEELFDSLLARLNQEDYLKEFQLEERQSCPTLACRREGDCAYITFRAKSDKGQLVVEPEYGCRFDIVHHWFEPFSQKPIQEQRDRSTISFCGASFERQNRFRFGLSRLDDEDEYRVMRDVVLANGRSTFNTFRGLYQVYGYLILRVIQDGVHLPAGGEDWIFERAALARCLDEDDEYYQPFKRCLQAHISHLSQRRIADAHYEAYRDRYDEIFDYLEHYDFTAELVPYLEADDNDKGFRF